MSIARIGEFHAQEGQEAALRDFLQTQIVPAIAAAPGCEECRAWQREDDPRRFLVLEVWTSVEAHRASVAQIPAAMIAQVRPLLADAPPGGYYRPL